MTPTPLQQQQIAFAQAIRDPAGSPIPEGVAEARMSVYRELFFNNIRGSLEGAFPVLHEIMPDSKWEALLRRFFAEHQSQTPEFVRLPGEFLHWLQDDHPNPLPGDLLELAAWEWSELEVMLAPTIEMASIDPEGDMLQGIPQLNPTLRLHRFSWPVHQLSAQHYPAAPLETPIELLVLRTPEDEMEFITLNATTAALIHQLRETPKLSGLQQLQQLAQRLSMQEETLLHYGPGFFQQLRQQSVLLGSSTEQENPR